MIAVLGATGKTGRYLVARLCDDGHEVTAVGRSRQRLDAVDARARKVVADLERPKTVAAALAGAARIASCAHARYTEAVLAALPECCERLVLTGSARRFSALPDPAADAVRAGEAAFLASGVAGVMLHPTMIYGAPDDRNVNRLLRLVRRRRVVPLPDGGRHLVQPVFVDDVVAALAGALTRAEAAGPPIVVAGPEPITYADMVRACARALGRSVVVVPVPAALLVPGLRLATAIGLDPPFDAAEILRATEDKSFDVTEMRARLGITPRRFAEGLALKLARGWA
ncbi:MAG: SDR family oxidoreductase [Alphaproteobacteria bacterium]